MLFHSVFLLSNLLYLPNIERTSLVGHVKHEATVTPVVNDEFHAFLLKKKAQMEMAATKKKIMVLDGVPAGNLLAPGTLGANGTQFDTNFTVSSLFFVILFRLVALHDASSAVSNSNQDAKIPTNISFLLVQKANAPHQETTRVQSLPYAQKRTSRCPV